MGHLSSAWILLLIYITREIKHPINNIDGLYKSVEYTVLRRIYYDPPKGERTVFIILKLSLNSLQRSMPEEEVDNKKPSEISSFHHMISSKNVLNMETVEVSKKRKFQTDQSELSLLPLSKHACFDNTACSDNTNAKSELDSECSVSCLNATSMECENETEMKEESSGSCSEDKMISFESHLDFIYGTQNLEDFSDKDIENILYLDEEEEEEEEEDDEARGCSNAANYVLSSGRWTVDQDSTQHVIKKPTIDQEFEQYFSTLML
ncbi:unnamed protein product [Eruca vesicaria subsp. sativa]|uniref:Uncharacterized protein n=1 Tax=Eruca vesicaria subsp. sativa TaxID=29727 RepID=A0ABC8LUP5_ERUVS|nr:unnamed protein product [Eruca vesicaria subsp. sativa]